MKKNPELIVVLVAALLGFTFAAFSTYDFAQHLDRQVHPIHCSFVPGLGEADASGSSGCSVTLMSSYSSVFRSAMWGGLPISLPAMSVFAFLFFWVIEMSLSGRTRDKSVLGFLVLATALPAFTSVIMAYVSLISLSAACKLCIGVYTTSAVSFLAAWRAWKKKPELEPVSESSETDADRDGPTSLGGSEPVTLGEPEDDPLAPLRAEMEGKSALRRSRPPQAAVSKSYLYGAFAIGVLFVAIPALAYVNAAPNYDNMITSCGTLLRPKDAFHIMVPLGGDAHGPTAVEVLDPLCPSCRAFEERYESASVHDKLSRQALLFPLDHTCNWMVDSAIHPGACTISEAVLCADKDAGKVLRWAFDHQEEVREQTKNDPGAAARLVSAAFPQVRSCLGSAEVKAKLNKSLRWAVKNQLRVLTPQLYVDGVKLCDEDVDLGLDYALTRMVEMKKSGKLPVPAEKPEPSLVDEAPAAAGGTQLTQTGAPAAPAAAEAPEAAPANEGGTGTQAGGEAGGQEGGTP
jgi:hypothetical protein